MVSATDPGVPQRPCPEDLAGRIARGEHAAETELVERFRPGLLVMLRHRLRDRQLAEDACQETFKIAIEKLRSGAIEDPRRLAGYVCGIAANLARKEYRRLRRANTGSTAVDASVADPGASAESSLYARERSELVRGVLSSMSPRDRELLTDFYLHEQEKVDVCRRLGLSADQFDVVKFRALRRFERLWSQHR
jgi:RNA polymerase sigma-70 factor (ECF subfamily)